MMNTKSRSGPDILSLYMHILDMLGISPLGIPVPPRPFQIVQVVYGTRNY